MRGHKRRDGQGGTEGVFFLPKCFMLSLALVLFKLQQTIHNNWLPGGLLPVLILGHFQVLWICKVNSIISKTFSCSQLKTTCAYEHRYQGFPLQCHVCFIKHGDCHVCSMSGYSQIESCTQNAFSQSFCRRMPAVTQCCLLSCLMDKAEAFFSEQGMFSEMLSGL